MKKLLFVLLFFANFIVFSYSQTQVKTGNDRDFIPGDEYMKMCVYISYSSGEGKIVNFYLSFKKNDGYLKKGINKNVGVLYGMEKHNKMYIKMTERGKPIPLTKGKCYTLIEVSPNVWIVKKFESRK